MSNLKKVKIAIMGNSSTQHLATAIKGYGYLENFNFEILDADYNQIDAEIMDENSETYNFNPDYILIYMSTEKIYEDFCRIDISSRDMFADNMIDKIKNYWQMINTRTNTNIIQFNFVENDDRIFGNFSNKLPNSFIYQIRKLNS